jgi:peptidyl-tRNA hydrolase
MFVAQYIVARRDIIEKHGFGFIAAQLCHASVAPVSNQLRVNFSQAAAALLDDDTRAWLNGTFVKYVYEVHDLPGLLGLTQRLDADGITYASIIESKIGELTCIGLKPYNKGRVAPYFRSMKLLGG